MCDATRLASIASNMQIRGVQGSVEVERMVIPSVPRDTLEHITLLQALLIYESLSAKQE